MDPFSPPGMKFPSIQDMEQETLKRMGLAQQGLNLIPPEEEETETEEEEDEEDD